jgi:hypothetical protein
MMQAAFPEGCPPYNTTRHKLGRLCKRGHEWGTTGQSLRFNSKISHCLWCQAEDAHVRYKGALVEGAEAPQWVYDPTRSTLKTAAPARAQPEDPLDDDAAAADA